MISFLRMRILSGLGLICATIALHAGGSDAVSLAQILAPVHIKPASQVVRESDAQVPSRPARSVSKPQEVPVDAVMQRLEEWVARDLEAGEHLTLRLLAKWEPFVVIEGQVWDLRLTNSFAPDVRGIWYASFDLLVDGELIESRYLRMQVALFKQVWMAQQRLDRGVQPHAPAIKAVVIAEDTVEFMP